MERKLGSGLDKEGETLPYGIFTAWFSSTYGDRRVKVVASPLLNHPSTLERVREHPLFKYVV